MTTLYTPEYLHVLRTAYADGKAPARVELLHMLDHVDTLTARLAAVRELHAPAPASAFGAEDRFSDTQFCRHCTIPERDLCEAHPCPTIQALDGDQ